MFEHPEYGSSTPFPLAKWVISICCSAMHLHARRASLTTFLSQDPGGCFAACPVQTDPPQPLQEAPRLAHP